MIKDLERRRAKGREAQARYRRRHPERDRAYYQSERGRTMRADYKARNRDRLLAADRAAHLRRRNYRELAGKSPALDALLTDLKASRDKATRQRLIAAIEHMAKVVIGDKVKPRGPRPGRDRLRPIPRIPFYS